MSANDGGPYHPCQPLNGQGLPLSAMEYGASLRDHFAGLAMQGHVVALGNMMVSADSQEEAKGKWAEIVAELAYRTANAMLRARENGA